MQIQVDKAAVQREPFVITKISPLHPQAQKSTSSIQSASPMPAGESASQIQQPGAESVELEQKIGATFDALLTLGSGVGLPQGTHVCIYVDVYVYVCIYED